MGIKVNRYNDELLNDEPKGTYKMQVVKQNNPKAEVPSTSNENAVFKNYALSQIQQKHKQNSK